jgi:hypothetical protein
MAAAIAFNQALIRCGFSVDTAAAIVAEGFKSPNILSAVDEKDTDGMMKNVRDTRREMSAAAPGNMTFTFMAVKKFKAMQFWAKELVCCDCPLNIGLFADPLILEYLTHYEEHQERIALEQIEPDKPSEMKNLDNWEVWIEWFDTYCSNIYGAAKCPIKYVYHEKENPDPADFTAPYEGHDDYLIACTSLRNNWYSMDNKRIYKELKALCLGGSNNLAVAWTWIKSYDRQKDGRSALLALRHQCKGTVAKQTRKTAAYAKIATAKYSGQSKHFTLDQYVQIHQSTHNTLTDLEEPIPETKKVTDFLAGITDPRLNTPKDLILGDPAKINNFETCQQYLKTVSFMEANQDILQRNISGMTGGGGKRQHNGGKQGGKNGRNNLANRSYTNEEWKKLSKEQRAKIRAMHAAKKQKNDGNKHGGAGESHSKVSSIAQGSGDGSSQGASLGPGTAPANQMDAATQVTHGSSQQGGINKRG